MTLKKTSEEIQISFRLDETAANTFSSVLVNLPLDALNNEVFVCTSGLLDLAPPDAVAGTDTTVNAAITTTTVTAVPGINSSQCLIAGESAIRAACFVDGGVGFTDMAPDGPQAGMQNIGIIATPDFMVSIVGTQNVNPKSVNGRLYGFRARASSSVYASLVQSELLS